MAVNLKSKAIDPHDPAFQPMLDNLQGNILKGHGRDHTVHIFLSFRPAPTLKAKFKAVATRIVTSAARQRDESDLYKKFGVPGGLFGNVLLSATGYKKLGVTTAFGDAHFRDGMRAHGGDFNDPAPATWELGFAGGPIDAMLLLADDDADFLLRETRKLLNDIAGFADVMQIERGSALRNKQGEGIEHFGYVDGRSQPIYFALTPEEQKEEGDTDKWDPNEPLERVLVDDPATSAADSFGSYFVFRKLEQNVRGFKIREQDVADAMGLVGDDRERAGAMAVGRFENGTPLVLSQVDGFLPAKENNFQYDIDPEGSKCPFHAHIRKSNPRGDIRRKLVPGGNDEQLERVRRITRRGIPYGARLDATVNDPLAALPTKDVGLLFMCFQASIVDQFSFIQQSWVNAAGFVQPNTGLDPVIAMTAAAPTSTQTWHPDWGTKPTPTPPVTLNFGQFVTMKGGEFFFAPSLPFLNGLK